LETITRSQQPATSIQDCSTSTSPSALSKTISSQDRSDSITTSAMSNNNLSTIPTHCQDTNMSTILAQDIQIALIALLALLAVLLAIVTAGWVCTCCWAMQKSRKREMNISTTNIR
jgi:hypothetical protein